MSPRVVVASLSALTLLIAGCSGEGGELTTTAPPAGVATDSTVPNDGVSTTSVAATDTTQPDTTQAESPADLAEVAELGVVTLNEVEPGPHPVLSWEPFEGASSYWLTVIDSGDDPYWAWTGKVSSVRVGGGQTEETNQTAAIHEDMIWRIAAFDPDGELIALSQAGTISP